MIAIRMVERNPAQGNRAKRYVYKGMHFEAGDAGHATVIGGRVREQVNPSPVYPMEDAAAVEYLTGRDEYGNFHVHQEKDPGKPVFVVEYLTDREGIARTSAELATLGFLPTFPTRALDGRDPLDLPVVAAGAAAAATTGTPEFNAKHCNPKEGTKS